MTKPHKNWPHLSSAVFYDDAPGAIDWLCNAFGFQTRVKVEGEGGRIEHSELTFGDGVVMIASVGGKKEGHDRSYCKSPRSVDGANTQSLCIYVPDVDKHCERARAAGAKILTEPRTDDYGEAYGANRTYQALDPEGHHWWFLQVVRDGK